MICVFGDCGITKMTPKKRTKRLKREKEEQNLEEEKEIQSGLYNKHFSHQRLSSGKKSSNFMLIF